MKTTKTILTASAILFALVTALPAKAQIFDDDKKKEEKKNDNKKTSKSSSSTGTYGYQTGIGVRGGWTSGLTIKHFISGNAAIEGIIGSRWHGFSIAALYEIHKTPALGFSRLAWEYGGGARIGFYSGRYYREWDDNNYYYDRNYTVISLVGVFGLEYQFGEIPFTASLDIMPYFDLIGRGGDFIDGSMSFRYAF